MLECEECRNRVGTIELSYHSSMFDSCKVLKGEPEEHLLWGFQIPHEEESNNCLFFKPHCGKCGGNCGKV